ncbi:hypothetical protein [Atopomonas hussainii]|uniref:hypothetical protein n=1 Tax=Atopomonas hussainii TaxID=1429083 RepID=UPI00111396F5|nr:hypothetical protein [Atopomonas hussainii]
MGEAPQKGGGGNFAAILHNQELLAISLRYYLALIFSLALGQYWPVIGVLGCAALPREAV